MPSTLLLGPVNTLATNVIYAMPARATFGYTNNTNLEVSVNATTGFVALTVSSGAFATAATFIRCTSGTALVAVKAVAGAGGSGTGGGTPGGSDTQVQYNNAGSFGGITGATSNGTALTLVAPVLGTPASGTLTNCTGLPISTGVSGLGTNVATFLATPSSANLAAAVTDETGTGALVFATGPTLVAPITVTGVAGVTAITAGGATQTASFPILDLTQTWNNGAVTFTGLKANFTNTASAAASLLIDLQVGATSQFAVTRSGKIVLVATGGIGVNATGNVTFNSSAETVFISAANYLNDSSGYFGWRAAATRLFSDASNQLDLRNGTSPQEIRPHGYYASATGRTYGAVKCVNEAVTLSGASTATANIVPVGSFIIGVATTTTTLITGASGYQVGDGSDADRWGDITGTAVGTDSDNTDSTANPTGYVAAASAVTLTAKTSNFTGGVVQVTVYYLTTGAD